MRGGLRAGPRGPEARGCPPPGRVRRIQLAREPVGGGVPLYPSAASASITSSPPSKTAGSTIRLSTRCASSSMS